MPGDQPKEPEINKLFRLLMKYKGTSMCLEAGMAPTFLIGGVSRSLNMKPLSQDDLLALLRPIMDSRQQHSLDEHGRTDFVYACQFRVDVTNRHGQLRVSAYWDRLLS